MQRLNVEADGGATRERSRTGAGGFNALRGSWWRPLRGVRDAAFHMPHPPGSFGLPICDPESLHLRARSRIRNVWTGASGRRDSYGNNDAGFV